MDASYSTLVQVGITSLNLPILMACSTHSGIQDNISIHLLRLLGNLLINSVHLSEAAPGTLVCCLVITVTVGFRCKTEALQYTARL